MFSRARNKIFGITGVRERVMDMYLLADQPVMTSHVCLITCHDYTLLLKTKPRLNKPWVSFGLEINALF